MIIDLDVLRALRDVSPDDPEFVSQVIGLCLDEVPPDLLKLGEAFDRGDAAQMGFVAHHLKSSLQNVGANSLSQICNELEQMGREGRVSGARELIAKFTFGFAEAKAVLLAIQNKSLGF